MDPVLSDSGGNAALGPKIQHLYERFNLALDCSRSGARSLYAVLLHPTYSRAPTVSPFGFAWDTGPLLLRCIGTHTQNVVECMSLRGSAEIR